MLRNFSLLITCILLLISISCNRNPVSEHGENSEWKQLFNGKDLSDWTIKISQHELNENFGNTFRVNEGMLQVRYDEYESFDRQFGHIFFNDEFSHYILRVEYRFVGEQVSGGEGWALRNSGAMLHSQNPASMLRDQDFPISIEGQILGGDGRNERTTSNLCTPGTHVHINGELITDHCVSSSSKTYHGEQWVTAEFLVLGDSIVHHILEGHAVLTYQRPEIGGGNVDPVDPEVKMDGQRLSSGFIALQSESHPIDFRKVELFDLSAYNTNQTNLSNVLRNLGYSTLVQD